MERIQRILSSRGVASRRVAEEMIVAGRVSVNGTTVTELGTKADPINDEIRVDGRVVRPQRRRYIMLNKPRGFITTTNDDRDRSTVMELVQTPERLYPVGRLDRDTEGLLLLTNDGELANRVMHPKFGLEKEYHVLTPTLPSPETIERVRRGVLIDGRRVTPNEFRLYRETRDGVVLTISLHEGMYHVVRRMMDAAGIVVDRLTRIRVGPLMVAGVPIGLWRDLSAGEEQSLFEAVHMELPEEDAARRRNTEITVERERAQTRTRGPRPIQRREMPPRAGESRAPRPVDRDRRPAAPPPRGEWQPQEERRQRRFSPERDLYPNQQQNQHRLPERGPDRREDRRFERDERPRFPRDERRFDQAPRPGPAGGDQHGPTRRSDEQRSDRRQEPPRDDQRFAPRRPGERGDRRDDRSRPFEPRRDQRADDRDRSPRPPSDQSGRRVNYRERGDEQPRQGGNPPARRNEWSKPGPRPQRPDNRRDDRPVGPRNDREERRFDHRGRPVSPRQFSDRGPSRPGKPDDRQRGARPTDDGQHARPAQGDRDRRPGGGRQDDRSPRPRRPSRRDAV
jgi:23S rRNA pseudouridine2605 synthase